MEKRDLHSPDLAARNVEKIAALFPSVITEAADADGNIVRSVDFDLLRQELSDHIVEGPQERYRLDWPGKRAAAFAANAPIAKTLRPMREESVDFDTTKNLFIEGDNLDALKLLQESYLGKVKLIYIDPPYNTNTDLVYPDSFAVSVGEYLAESGQANEAGYRLSSYEEPGGRKHSKWLSMIYPRLKLAKNLLRDDGVLLVSINDIEAASLRLIGSEVFGEDNFVTQFVWLNSGNVDQSSKIKGLHEYVIAFARRVEFLSKPGVIDPNVEETSKLFRDRIENSIVKNGSKNPPSTVMLPAGFPAVFESGFLAAGSTSTIQILDDITVDNFVLTVPARVRSGWSSRNLLELFIANDCTVIEDSEGRESWFELTSTGAIQGVKKRSSLQGHVTSILRNMGTTEVASNELRKLGLDFSYPKPELLVRYLTSVFTSRVEPELVVDLFAGSGTTAEAVLRQNARDGGDRSFILVQYPERLANGGTIASLCRTRVERVGRAVQLLDDRVDVGFRSLIVDTTNIADIFHATDSVNQGHLDIYEKSVKSDRTAEDLLFQVLIDWGMELSLPIEQIEVGKSAVHIVDGGALAACFDASVTPEVLRTMAVMQPLRVVFRDSGFATDAARINAEQIFRELSPATEVRTI